MSSAGFSKPTNYWGAITGLAAKSSSDGKTSQSAEAPDEYGDTAAADVFGEVMNPSVEYAVTDEVDLSDISLGKIYADPTSGSTKKFMLTQCQVNTAANTPPTVTLSGVEVEAGATDKRLYELEGTILPRSKSQDVAGAFTAPTSPAAFTSINTTFAVDPHVQTIKGAPVVSDASHGRIEVQATMTDPSGVAAIAAAANSNFIVTASPAETASDASYVTRAATAVKYLEGEEASAAAAASS